MSAALKNLDRWIYLMHQAHEASYYIGRAEDLGHPHLWNSHGAILEFLAHFRSALNSYAKCFVRAGRGRIKLEEAKVFSDEPGRLVAHGRIMDLRHKYVAHSDSNELETVRVIEDPSEDELVVRFEYGLSFPFDRLYELRDLIRFIEGHIVDSQQKQISRVERDIGKPVRILQGQEEMLG